MTNADDCIAVMTLALIMGFQTNPAKAASKKAYIQNSNRKQGNGFMLEKL